MGSSPTASRTRTAKSALSERGDWAVTTDETPSSEGSGSGATGETRESTAAAMRRRREEGTTDQALAEVRRETRELAVTMGGVSKSLADIAQVIERQSHSLQAAQAETIPVLGNLATSARDSYRAMEREVNRLGAVVLDAMAKGQREQEEGRRLQDRVLGWAALIALLLACWVGWKVKEWRAEKELEVTKAEIADLKAERKGAGLFADFMLQFHPGEVKKYQKDFLAWSLRPATKP
jgi:hypothetical protein